MDCCNSAVINAPADKVWAALRNFHDMSAFPNVFERTEIADDTPGTETGARRVLDNAFHETLICHDGEKSRLDLQYRRRSCNRNQGQRHELYRQVAGLCRCR
jgi:hypothetical protein